jgi:anti-sigma B factor antagonist
MFSAEWSTGGSGGQAVVALRGELDVVDAASLAAALMAAVAREPVIVADLAALEFIDSSGAAALVLACKQARRAGGDLLLAGPQDQVQRFLTVSGLADVISVRASVEDAARDAGRSRQAPAPAPQSQPGDAPHRRVAAMMQP